MDLSISGLVNNSLEYDILAGVPFCKANEVDVLLSKDLIIPYCSKPESIQHSIFPVESVIVSNDKSRVLYLGITSRSQVRLQIDSPLEGMWPSPTISQVIQGSIRIPNHSEEPIHHAKYQHFAQIRRVTTSSQLKATLPPVSIPTTIPKQTSTPTVPFSSTIKTDPDKLLTTDMRLRFQHLQQKRDNVFNQRIGCYNGASGPFVGEIKFGRAEPPATKTKIPLYNQSNLCLLQAEADKLEDIGVLVEPEVAGVDVEFASPSFLRLKPSGDYRFVTSFTELGQYIRTLPVRTVTSDMIIRGLAKWKYVIKTDLTQSFFQIPISKQSMKYLATVTPFKGLRVYTTLVMGMPGSSEILQELMSRIFGNEMMEGWIYIIADDMYICSNTPDELLQNWERVLEKMSKNGLSLSSVKTLVCPKTFNVLGWKWTSGTISISPHKITPLLSTEPPKTCSNMRSFIGAFKAMSRCIPRYSSLASPLEESIKGLNGSQHVTWTEELLEYFKQCKEALKSPLFLTVPTPEDNLMLTVDASPINAGIGATLFT